MAGATLLSSAPGLFRSRNKRTSALEREKSMKNYGIAKRPANRRSFLRNGVFGLGATAIVTGQLPAAPPAFGHEDQDEEPVTRGDIAVLKFLSALEQVEADLWIQYAELGGATNQGLSPIDLPFKNGLAPNYITALEVLDGDMPQYISDNTDDEIATTDFSITISHRRARTLSISVVLQFCRQAR
jgi:hypothetical protein